jgi:hypothetical protein
MMNSKMKSCIVCENYTPQNKACKLCGCYMPAKTLLPFAKCPAGKW